MAEYNFDPSMLAPGGLAGAPPPERLRRKITLLQRNAGVFEATLKSSAGWILRDKLCRVGVELIARYRCRDDRRVRRSNDAELRLRATNLPVHVIGGARHRCHAERDASDQAPRLAARERRRGKGHQLTSGCPEMKFRLPSEACHAKVAADERK